MRKLIAFGVLFICLRSWSQSANDTNNEAWKKIYRASATKINDLVHTKLELKFEYSRAWMYGKAWLTLHPHFYPTDSLNLDAKAMTIQAVSLVRGNTKIPLRYRYDSMNLHIRLDKSYKAGENYTIYIDYISRPDEHEWPSGDAKGLYFINPRGENKHKPTQIWTFGETEFNSSWCPTIDKPNQKTTSEIILTVPSKYLTLSNGLLTNQKNNNDGTRTDVWKLDLPFAPYLLFFAVGDYAVIKDSYKGKEVSYYVEKDYASLARKIFGNTPGMIAFFSGITGVDYPWPKYAQITGRDFVAGAQENVTATLHAENAQQDARQLVDGNRWEETIAHELFHQWFGDLVTCESWSNITVNESFANYSETLWDEYKYGKEEGDAKNNFDMLTYLESPGDTSKNLVRFYYADPEDVFDNVSYPKGGRILNMLRHYVGDSAFFKSLNLYLTTNKFKSAEAQSLKFAFEEVTGQDLNWFFNQWYYGSGHPRLDIRYAYDATGKTAKVFITQTQSGNPFKIPFAIDVYAGGSKKRYDVWMKQATDSFSFAVDARPELINVDADKILLCEKTDHKSLDEFIYQYDHAGLFVDKREAILFAALEEKNPKALEFLVKTLGDTFWQIRLLTLKELNTDNDTVKRYVKSFLVTIAKNDDHKKVQAEAILLLGKYKNPAYKSLFLAAIHDSSYTVAGNALEALAGIDSSMAEEMAKKLLEQPAKGVLLQVLFGYMDENNFDSLSQVFKNLPINRVKLDMTASLTKFLAKVKNTNTLKKGVDLIVSFREEVPVQYHGYTDPYINGELQKLLVQKQARGLTEQADYIKSKIPPAP